MEVACQVSKTRGLLDRHTKINKNHKIKLVQAFTWPLLILTFTFLLLGLLLFTQGGKDNFVIYSVLFLREAINEKNPVKVGIVPTGGGRGRLEVPT